jgi:hypothetical protein
VAFYFQTKGEIKMSRKNRKAAPEKAKHTWPGSQGAWANAWCDASRKDGKDPEPTRTGDEMESLDEASSDGHYK